MEKALLLYSSPHNATRTVAKAIGERFKANGYALDIMELKNIKHSDFGQLAEKLRIIIIGTPIYLDHPLKNINNFVMRIPKQKKRLDAVVFTTYGLASTGVVIKELASKLRKKNIQVIAAANIPGEHTIMFQGGNPLGKGRPNEADLEAIKAFTNQVIKKLGSGNPKGILPMPKRPLWYRIMSACVFRMNVLGKTFPQIFYNSTLCVNCGKCHNACPVGEAVSKNSTPGTGNQCLHCYECVRVCSNGACSAQLKEFEWKIKRKQRMVASFETFDAEFFL